MLVRLLFWSASAVALVAWEPSRAAGNEDAGGVRFSAQAMATFNSRCTACHTYGKGVKVGPDLKGVTERRPRGWLVPFIHGSSAMIASGDRIAVALFSEFKQQRMPDWTELSEKQINDILDYLAAGGPDVKPHDERNAETAAAGEAELGRELFDGEVRFTAGGQACSSCHAAGGSRWLKGGSLGPELTGAYLKFQDKALTSYLRQPCFRWDPSVGGDHHLTPRESFALKVFLRQSAPAATVPASVVRAPGLAPEPALATAPAGPGDQGVTGNGK
jgi:mono/diheme cytochrome c family protein